MKKKIVIYMSTFESAETGTPFSENKNRTQDINQ